MDIVFYNSEHPPERICKQCERLMPDSGRGLMYCMDCMPHVFTAKHPEGMLIVISKCRSQERRLLTTKAARHHNMGLKPRGTMETLGTRLSLETW